MGYHVSVVRVADAAADRVHDLKLDAVVLATVAAVVVDGTVGHYRWSNERG